MLHGFAVPTRRSARGSRSSTWMLCIEPWESLTQNFAAPPAAAPSMHAFASSAIHLRARSYSRPCIITWLWAATPPMPSMSTEIHTLLAARFGTAAMGRGLIECCGRDRIDVSRRSGEKANTVASGAAARKGVGDQVPPSAQSVNSVASLVVIPNAPLAIQFRHVCARIDDAKQRDGL